MGVIPWQIVRLRVACECVWNWRCTSEFSFAKSDCASGGGATLLFVGGGGRVKKDQEKSSPLLSSPRLLVPLPKVKIINRILGV